MLLRRNRLALLNALVLPVLLVFALKAAPGVSDAGGSRGAGAILLTALVAFALLSAVCCNLVMALVAHREQLVLKRLRTGESTGPEILAGTAVPAFAIAWAEIAVAAVAAVAVFGLAPPVNAVLALIVGTAVFALLAAVSAAATRTVEMAQVTTLPVLVIPFVLSGLLIPVAMLPGPLRGLAQALPLTPVAELIRLALTGAAAGGHRLGLAATFSAAVIAVLVLTAWIAAAGWAARRWFRWEPRR